MFDRFVSWLYTKRIWGPRCSHFHPDCAVCGAWKLHDELFGGTE
jgi:hypothetical protein